MAFDDIVFPDRIAYGAAGGPEFDTDVVTMPSGVESRNQRRDDGIVRYDVSYGLQTHEDIAELNEFFRCRRGMARSFRFKDFADFSATASQIGIGTGAQLTFQMVKIYDDGVWTQSRKITKPITGTVALRVNAVLQTDGVDYTVNYLTGIVTFAVAPADALVIDADFEFHIPMRLDTDQYIASISSHERYNWGGIPLVEVDE